VRHPHPDIALIARWPCIKHDRNPWVRQVHNSGKASRIGRAKVSNWMVEKLQS
jgi:hypothetical protein